MRNFLRRRGPAIQIVIGILVTAMAAADMVGKPARVVGVLAVGAGMFGAGLGLGLALARRGARGGRGS
jgi:hypothetical protein